MNIKLIFYRSYHLRPSTKGVYPVQLMDEDYVDFHRQMFMQNSIYRNHFFNYEDTQAKCRSWRDDISTGVSMGQGHGTKLMSQ